MTPMEQQFVAVVSIEIFTHREGKPGKTQSLSSNEASKLLGMLIAENRASIEEIAQAAQEAERSKIEQALRQAAGDAAITEHVVVEFELDTAAFFRAIAREVTGQGSARGEFGLIVLRDAPLPSYARLAQRELTDVIGMAPSTIVAEMARELVEHRKRFTSRPLSIPRLNIEGARS